MTSPERPKPPTAWHVHHTLDRLKVAGFIRDYHPETIRQGGMRLYVVERWQGGILVFNAREAAAFGMGFDVAIHAPEETP